MPIVKWPIPIMGKLVDNRPILITANNQCTSTWYWLLHVCLCAVTEEQCLSQIYHDELFGAQDWNAIGKKAEEDKKK